MTAKILITGASVKPELFQPLRDQGWIVENPTHLLSEEELTEALTDTDAYLLGGDERASRSALEQAGKLKIIAFLGMGYEAYVDSDAARDRGIVITNTPGTLSNAVAELTIGHLLSSVRKIHYYAELFEQGTNGSEEKQRDIANLRHGIVGMGGIGTRVAQILRLGFGAEVSYFSRTRKPDLEQRLDLNWANSLGELASAVDTLVVLTPGNDETLGMVDGTVFDRCRPGTVLINTARPEIVSAAGLREALDSGKVSYAAFDDFYEESGEDTVRLRSYLPEKMMITGHIGSLTSDARDAMGILAIKSIMGMLKSGEPVHRVV